MPFKIISFRKTVNKIGFNKLLDQFEGSHLTKDADNAFLIKLNKFHKAATFFLIRIFKDPNPCIIRSLILYDMCSKDNIKSSLKTGVFKDKDVLIGHSWLEINSIPVGEDKENLSKFTIISEV
jgi:hypothetical protein